MEEPKEKHDLNVIMAEKTRRRHRVHSTNPQEPVEVSKHHKTHKKPVKFTNSEDIVFLHSPEQDKAKRRELRALRRYLREQEKLKQEELKDDFKHHKVKSKFTKTVEEEQPKHSCNHHKVKSKFTKLLKDSMSSVNIHPYQYDSGKEAKKSTRKSKHERAAILEPYVVAFHKLIDQMLKNFLQSSSAEVLDTKTSLVPIAPQDKKVKNVLDTKTSLVPIPLQEKKVKLRRSKRSTSGGQSFKSIEEFGDSNKLKKGRPESFEHKTFTLVDIEPEKSQKKCLDYFVEKKKRRKSFQLYYKYNCHERVCSNSLFLLEKNHYSDCNHAYYGTTDYSDQISEVSLIKIPKHLNRNQDSKIRFLKNPLVHSDFSLQDCDGFLASLVPERGTKATENNKIKRVVSVKLSPIDFKPETQEKCIKKKDTKIPKKVSKKILLKKSLSEINIKKVPSVEVKKSKSEVHIARKDLSESGNQTEEVTKPNSSRLTSFFVTKDYKTGHINTYEKRKTYDKQLKKNPRKQKVYEVRYVSIEPQEALKNKNLRKTPIATHYRNKTDKAITCKLIKSKSTTLLEPQEASLSKESEQTQTELCNSILNLQKDLVSCDLKTEATLYEFTVPPNDKFLQFNCDASSNRDLMFDLLHNDSPIRKVNSNISSALQSKHASSGYESYHATSPRSYTIDSPMGVQAMEVNSLVEPLDLVSEDESFASSVVTTDGEFFNTLWGVYEQQMALTTKLSQDLDFMNSLLQLIQSKKIKPKFSWFPIKKHKSEALQVVPLKLLNNFDLHKEELKVLAKKSREKFCSLTQAEFANQSILDTLKVYGLLKVLQKIETGSFELFEEQDFEEVLKDDIKKVFVATYKLFLQELKKVKRKVSGRDLGLLQLLLVKYHMESLSCSNLVVQSIARNLIGSEEDLKNSILNYLRLKKEEY